MVELFGMNSRAGAESPMREREGAMQAHPFGAAVGARARDGSKMSKPLTLGEAADSLIAPASTQPVPPPSPHSP